MCLSAALILLTLGAPCRGWTFSPLALVPEALTPKILWQERYLASKISYRLIKKSWRPKGVDYEDVLPEFKGNVTEAFNILWNDPGYEYLEEPLGSAELLFTRDSEFEPSKDSIIIIHPLFGSADVFFVRTTIIALGMLNLHKKYNVFAVDMPVLNINMMVTVFKEFIGYPPMYEPMSQVLSSFMVKGILKKYWQPSKIHLLGFSYSGNLVGYIGRYIHFLHQEKIASIMCLDPYSAGYNKNLLHISRDDATVVHIVHTSSLLHGTRERLGTADFVFNDGLLQPECSKQLWKRTIPEPFTCSHLKVVPRFWYVILYPSRFQARRCDSWQRFKECLCNDNQEGTLTFPIGDNAAEGVYYLKTTGTKPYGMGEYGSKCAPEKKAELEKKREDEVSRIMFDPNILLDIRTLL